MTTASPGMLIFMKVININKESAKSQELFIPSWQNLHLY